MALTTYASMTRTLTSSLSDVLNTTTLDLTFSTFTERRPCPAHPTIGAHSFGAS